MESFKFENTNTEENFFDKQWNHPKTVKVFGENRPFDVYDISPEEGKFKTEVPLVLGMGWAESPESHKNHIRQWVEKGREVICPDTPHGISANEREEYKAIELRKMEALIETLRARGIEIKEDGVETGKADMMGRSEGAIFSIILAYLYPQLVRNLILENPAGLIGDTNAGEFALHWLKDMKQNIRKEYEEENPSPPKTEADMFEILNRNMSAGAKSVLAITSTDVREMLKDIKKSGIGIAVIATTDDQLFPIERMAGKVEPEPMSVTGREKIIPELTSEYVDGFYSLRGAHASYLLNPEKFAMVVDQALEALEAKKKKEKEKTEGENE